MTLLGVNVDHVATLRQARETYEPDPLWAAAEAELGGADIITVHLRQDRRHICDRDVRLLAESVATELNLEMSIADEIVQIALESEPDMVTLVPENRQEVTTEGGLDVVGHRDRIEALVDEFSRHDIAVSLFIDPEREQIKASAATGAAMVELHTGCYANATGDRVQACLGDLERGAGWARDAGLVVNAGHGLTYRNVAPIVRRCDPHELHIGHSIVSRSVFVGMRQAVQLMKDAIFRATVLQ
jgi:pyridoxine 5-phosphate synthase